MSTPPGPPRLAVTRRKQVQEGEHGNICKDTRARARARPRRAPAPICGLEEAQRTEPGAPEGRAPGAQSWEAASTFTID